MQELIAFDICRYHDYYCRKFDSFIFVRNLRDEFFHEISLCSFMWFRIKRRVFPPRKIRQNFRATVKFLICIHRIGPICANVSSAARVVEKKKKKSIRFHTMSTQHTIYYIVWNGVWMLDKRMDVYMDIISKTGENNSVIFLSILFFFRTACFYNFRSNLKTLRYGF